MNYARLIDTLYKTISSNAKERKKILLVCIDGPDCSGKSTLSKDLSSRLMLNYKTILIHYDDYLNPVELRGATDKFQMEDFYNNYFSEAALKNSVLIPVQHLNQEMRISVETIIIIEGLFLCKNEMYKLYDLVIRIEMDNEKMLSRALKRDVGILGTAEWVYKHYTLQCIPAQNYYRKHVKPEQYCDIFIRVLEDDRYDIRCRSFRSGK